MRRTFPIAFAAALLCGAALSVAQVAVPPLKARVTDLTGTLTAEQSAALEAKLRALEERKGSQLAVLIVPTTEPEDIAEFGIRVGETWKLGRKGVDDGAILIVAKDDRRMRIEVGYGLEGPLPDAIAKRIVAETITPHFKQGDFYGGIDAGVDQMIKVVEGEPLPEPDRGWSPGPGGGDWLVVALVLTVIAGSVLRLLFGRMGGALATGGVVGFVTYLITHILPIAGLIGVAGFILSLLFGGSGGPRGWVSRGRHGGLGGWTGGGFGGGSFGGGGGFSGGGGGFGGGGASGSW
ncbi:MAG TPA: YgcG family protein [Steroidobacteraceae bacterium]|nr:YgcG family protein [Steroidobacteraceae bacterium]